MRAADAVFHLECALDYTARRLRDHAGLLTNESGIQLCRAYVTVAQSCVEFLKIRVRKTGNAQFYAWCQNATNLVLTTLQTTATKRTIVVTQLIAHLRRIAFTLQSYQPDDVEMARVACCAILTPHVIKLAVTQNVHADSLDLFTLAAVAVQL